MYKESIYQDTTLSSHSEKQIIPKKSLFQQSICNTMIIEYIIVFRFLKNLNSGLFLTVAIVSLILINNMTPSSMVPESEKLSTKGDYWIKQ